VLAAGSTPAKRPVQLSTRFLETPGRDSLRSSTLSSLPNATQAEYWVRKARQLQCEGKYEVRQPPLTAIQAET
jgi:hypothetical protein